MSNIEVKIDYLSATFPLDCDYAESTIFKVYQMVELVANFFNISSFEILKETYAQNNFNYQFTLGENIILRLDGPLNDFYQKTCHLELKGEACREFEHRCKDKTWEDLIFFLASLNARFKRIDLALDDYSGEDVTLDYVYQKVRNHYYTSVFKSNPRPIGTIEDGLTLQFGTNSSDTELVIYDKVKERQRRKKDVDKDYWVRYEMRFRKKNAESFVTLLLKNFKELQSIAYQQLYRILDIKEDNSYSVREQSRVSTDAKWFKFLNSVEKGILPKDSFNTKKTFNNYMLAATPYVSTFLLYKFISVDCDPYLFELELFKFMRDELQLSKKSHKNLNIYLNDSHLNTIDDVDLSTIKQKIEAIIEDKELPF